EKPNFSWKVTVGGGDKLAGATYYWFFTAVMLGTAVLFIGVAFFYQPREYLQEEAPADDALAGPPNE
ncbi:MAG: hypothetical protein N2C12_17385, partial [Planctomycetales bacterium]